MIKNLNIQNYKSIHRLDLNCSKINVFIGEPNSGKSNILEALDLSYLSWMMGMNEGDQKAGKELIDLKKFFRINKVEDMFYLGNISTPIVIRGSGVSYDTKLETKYDEENDKKFFEWKASNSTLFDNDLIPLKPIQFFASPIKPYRYKNDFDFHDVGNYIDKLRPPFGNNLGKVIMSNKDMQLLTKEFAEKNNFEFNIDRATGNIFIQLRVNDGLVYSLPYEALADTFKRILFYIAAIRHNNGGVITLDEPDTHAFPPYVSYVADEIIKQKNCQFFLATHNPYLLNNLIENTPANDLAVFVCSYDKSNKTTMAKKLTSNDLSELLDYGVDIFFNLNRYLNDSIEYTS